MNDIEVQMPKKLGGIFSPRQFKVMYGGRGGGKCLALGTRVIMADGTLRAIEDVREGEQVMGPDSRPRTVLGTTRGYGQLWMVRQTSGMDYVVNDAHILSVKKSISAAKETRIQANGNPRSPNGRYPSWPAVTNIGVQDYAAQSQRWQSHFRGYKAGMLRFPERDVAVDPYLLGIWLGDGSSDVPAVTTADPEVIAYIKAHAESWGGVSKVSGKLNNKARHVTFRKKAGKFNLIWDGFKKYGLPRNKHIPQEYLSNSESVRLSLLAGLIDSDGHRQNGGYSITQTRESLAREIKFLADGLGFRTSIIKRKTICTNNGVRGVAWRVSITGNTWLVPSLLPHKQVKKEDLRKNKDFLLSQIKVSPIGDGEWAGFSLDGDHLFLLEDGTVTHNSHGVAQYLIIRAMQKAERILCVREVQKSINESSKRVIEDYIERMGVGAAFEVQQKVIICKATGSTFAFSGLKDHTADSIKSFEGATLVWGEEAASISAHSFNILIPTIVRTTGSEIILTFNPDQEDDYVYQRFVVNTDPDAWVQQINWRDNPWFNEAMDTERCKLQAINDDLYQHVWEGKCRSVAGLLFKRDWFQFYDVLPDRMNKYIASDYAGGPDPDNPDSDPDHTEHGVWGMSPDGDLYAIDWWFGQTDPAEWIDAWIGLVAKHKPRAAFEEKGVILRALDSSIAKRMKETQTFVRRIPLASAGSKAERALGFAARASGKTVYLPSGKPWAIRLLNQLCAFTGEDGRPDDAVDVCSLVGRGLDEMRNAQKPASDDRRGVKPFSRAWLESRDPNSDPAERKREML